MSVAVSASVRVHLRGTEPKYHGREPQCLGWEECSGSYSCCGFFLFSDFNPIWDTPHDSTSRLLFIPGKDRAEDGVGALYLWAEKTKIIKLVSIYPLPKAEITLCRMQF